MQNRNDSTWISWKEAIPIKFWDTTNWLTWNRPRGWFFDDLNAWMSGEADVLPQILRSMMLCRCRVDPVLWSLMSTIERYGKYDFLDKDHVELVVEEIPVCQFAGRSNCLGKSVGNLLARRTGCWFCQLLSFLENYKKAPLTSRLSPAWGDTTLYWSQWLKKGGDSESIGLSGKKMPSCDLWHHAECAFPCCLLALEVRWCLGSHWHSNGSREAMPAKPISSTVTKIFLRFMFFKGFLTI